MVLDAGNEAHEVRANLSAEFIRAASEGDIAALQRHPELVNTRHDGATALHFAAINRQMEAAPWMGRRVSAARFLCRVFSLRDFGLPCVG